MRPRTGHSSRRRVPAVTPPYTSSAPPAFAVHRRPHGPKRRHRAAPRRRSRCRPRTALQPERRRWREGAASRPATTWRHSCAGRRRRCMNEAERPATAAPPCRLAADSRDVCAEPRRAALRPRWHGGGARRRARTCSQHAARTAASEASASGGAHRVPGGGARARYDADAAARRRRRRRTGEKPRAARRRCRSGGGRDHPRARGVFARAQDAQVAAGERVRRSGDGTLCAGGDVTILRVRSPRGRRRRRRRRCWDESRSTSVSTVRRSDAAAAASAATVAARRAAPTA